MPVHTIFDLPSKSGTRPGTFDSKTSKLDIWRQSSSGEPTGYQMPILTRDPTSNAASGTVTYKGSKDSPRFIGPNKMHSVLTTSYQVDVPASSFRGPTPPKRIAILQTSTAMTAHDMLAPAVPSSGPQTRWTAPLERRVATILTDEGGIFGWNLDSQITFDRARSAPSRGDLTFRSAMLDRLASHAVAGTAYSAGVRSREQHVPCQVPVTRGQWTTKGSAKGHKLRIETDGSSYTLYDLNIAREILRSDNPELDQPFVLSGKETKIIDASYYPTVQVCLEPLPDSTLSRYGPGQRLGGAKPEGRGNVMNRT